MSVEPATVNVDEDRSVEALPDRKSTARATRGANGMVAILPPLRNTVSVR
ncbi:MAG: hypothetical protein M3488_08455 [Actinomycetota bacterium]|nr:hypothetical protein [Actinomycetota bacterium]